MLVGHTEGLPEDLTRLSTTTLLRDYAAADRAVDRIRLRRLISCLWTSTRRLRSRRYRTLTVTPLGRAVMAGSIEEVRTVMPAACPRSGDRLALIALIEDPPVIQRILSHLGLPTEVPVARPARPPPLSLWRSDTWYDDVP